MRWKQFFTPVKSFEAAEAKNYMRHMAADAFTLLDVRQPEEYESEHLPGAKLISLPELASRMPELDAQKPTIVYCAIGGRSRVAAQVLAAKGFREVFNLTGGIKAWSSGKAVGPQDLGLGLFSGKEAPAETLVVAYALEQGLFEFYQSMVPKVTNENARHLFGKLAAIEVKHQDRIFNEYIKLTGAAVSREDFTQKTVTPAMEGGLRPQNTSTGINRTWKRQKRSSRWPWRSRPRRWTFISALPAELKPLKARPRSCTLPTKSAHTWSNWASCLGNFSRVLKNKQYPWPSLCMTDIPPKPKLRDLRLDFFRGIALLLIFISHMPDNWLARYKPGAFGFSDSADIFVFVSGYAASLAYRKIFSRAGFFVGTARIVKRVAELYACNLGLFFIIATLCVAGDRFLDTGIDYINLMNLDFFFDHTPEALLGLYALIYVPNYFDILTMYMVVLAMMPLLMLLARVHVALAGFASIALYLCVVLFGWELPAEMAFYRPWFFNPFAWQFLFYTGFFLAAGWIKPLPFRRPAGSILRRLRDLGHPGQPFSDLFQRKMARNLKDFPRTFRVQNQSRNPALCAFPVSGVSHRDPSQRPRRSTSQPLCRAFRPNRPAGLAGVSRRDRDVLFRGHGSGCLGAQHPENHRCERGRRRPADADRLHGRLVQVATLAASGETVKIYETT